MRITSLLFLVFISAALLAGPPYDTDDPEPVMFQHWEVYFSSHLGYAGSQWAGTGPHLEVNYGVLPNTQLHLIAPLAFTASGSGKLNYGYGDTEIGIKFRFVDENSWLPQVGIFPLVELLQEMLKKSWGAEELRYTCLCGYKKHSGNGLLTEAQAIG